MVLGALAILAAVVLVVLWTPVDVELVAERKRGVRVDVRISWLYGLMTKKLERGSRFRRAETVPTKPRAGDSGSVSRASRIVRSEGFLQGVGRFARRALRGVEIRRAEFWARLGLDDPADTGRLFGYSFAAARAIQSALPVRIWLEPDFSGWYFDFRGYGAFRVVPAKILGPAVAFALSRPTLRAIWAARA